MNSRNELGPSEESESYDYSLEDMSEAEWLAAAMKNEVFAFLADPNEDIYTLEDATPYKEADN